MSSNENNAASVLVIDDDATLRITVEADLEDAGFIVRLAPDGASGLAAFQENPPDLVLLDVTMQGMDGFEVCKAIRAMPAGAHTPVMMLTGHDDGASVDRALSVGANDFAVKPINDAVLVHRVRFLLHAAETASQLRRERADLQKAQYLAKLGSWELDMETDTFHYRAELARLLGRDGTSSMSVKEFWSIIRVEDQALLRQAFQSALQEERPHHDLEFRLLRHDGEECCFHHYVEIVFDEAGQPVRVFGTLQDVTESRNAEARIESLAYFDSTTGLPNRNFFLSHLTRAMSDCDQGGSSLGVLMLHVGQLGKINKYWGHAVGDQVLLELAGRIKMALSMPLVRNTVSSEPGSVARFSGEVFALSLSGMRRPEDAARIAKRLIEALSVPIAIEHSQLVLDANVGICLYPTDGLDAQALLKHCTVALDTARASGRSAYAFYDEGDSANALERLSVEGRLRNALEREEFELYYQPKVTAEGHVVGMEALLRWHSEDGMISPAVFIPIAEETGIIRPIGEWVLKKACEQTQSWRQSGWDTLRISVNLSAIQLGDVNLVDKVQATLKESGLDPDALELELTESMLMDNVEQNVSTLRALRELGVHLSIDDFGTGFSSLQYLKNLPLTTLKIDRCFIQELETSSRDLAIVRGTIALAHSLGLHVVAEGVETEVQKARLFENNCDQIQGFLYSRPRPADEFIQWAEAHDSRFQGRQSADDQQAA